MSNSNLLYSPPATQRENLLIRVINQSTKGSGWSDLVQSHLFEYYSQNTSMDKHMDNLGVKHVINPGIDNSNITVSGSDIVVDSDRRSVWGCRPVLKPKTRPVRNPAWFLEIHLACFKCRRRCSRNNIQQHLKHTDGPNLYDDAILLREYHLHQWAELFQRALLLIIQKLKVKNRNGLISYINDHKLAEGLPSKIIWSKAYQDALQKYFDIYGGIINPQYITIYPANSCMALVYRPLFDKVREFQPQINTLLYKGLSKCWYSQH